MLTENKEIECFEFEQFRLVVSPPRLLGRDNKAISLPSKSFDILLLLVQNCGELLTKDELMGKVWSGQVVEENNLTVRIAALRKILGENRRETVFIQTVQGQGYRFVAEVTKNLKKTEARERDESSVSLAVLPMINESSDPDLEYISDGITESIINHLSQLQKIKVISRNTAYRYKVKDLDVRRISQELNVSVVLIARLYKVENQLVISAELIDARDESQIWGARFSHFLSNVFELQEIIANEVSSGLRLKLNLNDKVRLAKRHTKDSEAYLFYLKGLYLWNKRSVKDINKAIEYFRNAIKKDAGYALAYVGLADCYIVLCEGGLISSKEVILLAEEPLAKALEIDGSLAEAHTSQANIRGNYLRHWLTAENKYKLAIELNPNYLPTRYRFATHLAKLARFDEALFQLDKAQKIDPVSPVINKVKAKVLYLARRHDEAIDVCLEALNVETSPGPINGILSCLYIEKKMYREALEQIQRLVAFSAGDYQMPAHNESEISSQFEKRLIFSKADPEAIAIAGYIYAVTGEPDKARKIVEGLKKIANIRYVEPHVIAIVYSGLGDKDSAFEWLEKACRNYCPTITFLKVWSIFDSLRPDPRFDDLLQRLGVC